MQNACDPTWGAGVLEMVMTAANTCKYRSEKMSYFSSLHDVVVGDMGIYCMHRHPRVCDHLTPGQKKESCAKTATMICDKQCTVKIIEHP